VSAFKVTDIVQPGLVLWIPARPAGIDEEGLMLAGNRIGARPSVRHANIPRSLQMRSLDSRSPTVVRCERSFGSTAQSVGPQ
jgi:hypothetical protein